MKKRWRLKFKDEMTSKKMAEDMNISLNIAKILVGKNLTLDEAKNFLEVENTPFIDPFLMKDMDKTVERIILAKEKKEKVCIYGDYDVDGISSTTLLMKVLNNYGIDAEYFLPHRHTEGYGLNKNALEELSTKYDLIITVDCGITALKEVEFIKDKIDIIITDHHLTLTELPSAYSILNPHREDCTYPDKNICGVGVAFKLCQGIYIKENLNVDDLNYYLDIVALGTVADLVPIVGENRKMVSMGLKNINNLGIQKLLSVANCQKEKFNSGHIGFSVAPRLNASGRLNHAKSSVETLLAESPIEAQLLSENLNLENQKRQEIVENIVLECIEKIEKHNLAKDKIIILHGDNWNEGVIGIAASRIQDKYYRPVIIIAKKTDIGKASCRSIDGLNMKELLDFCSDDLIIYGGHSKAAGFSIELDKIEEFINHAKDYGDTTLKAEDLIPLIDVEDVVEPKDMNLDFLCKMEALEPFGMKNKKPLFVMENLYVKNLRYIGDDGKHLKLELTKDGYTFDSIGWFMGNLEEDYLYKNIDLCFQGEINTFNGNKKVQLKIEDIRENKDGDTFIEKYPSYEILKENFLYFKRFLEKNDGTTKSKLLEYNKKSSLKTSLQIFLELGILIEKDKKIYLEDLKGVKFDLKKSSTYNLRNEVVYI